MALNPLHTGPRPITISGPEIAWESPGVRGRPDGCKTCRLCYEDDTVGFVYDHIPEDMKVLFVFARPTKDEVVERKRGAGNAHWFWRKTLLAGNEGCNQEAVGVTSLIRCYPGYEYPTGKTRKNAESLCRQYDDQRADSYGKGVPGGILQWNPNVFVLTFDPSALVKAPAYFPLMQAAVRKAFWLVERGHRPAVLFGREVKDLLVPWLAGGIKDWQGTYVFGSWPKSDPTSNEGFVIP